MLRSMNAGISGMKGSQKQLDVIGNNIANVNTSGFKKGRATFQDLMSQMTSGAEEATDNRGGTNAQQIGLGSQVGSVDDIHTQGFSEMSENPLDLQIEGDGMFVLAEDVKGGENGSGRNVLNNADVSYSRSGNFYLDNNGNIVNSEGLYLIDTAGEIMNIPDEAEDFSIGKSGNVTYVENGEEEGAGQIALANFSNPEGLEKAGDSLYRETDNAGLMRDGNDIQLNEPGESGTGTIVSGALEMSNVDLSDEFSNMITAQRGFEANTRIITTSDEVLQELLNLKR